MNIVRTMLQAVEKVTVCVTRKWAGVDSVWEQEKPEAKKMSIKRAESHLSGARCTLCWAHMK
jgi:hypothetical protein